MGDPCVHDSLELIVSHKTTDPMRGLWTVMTVENDRDSAGGMAHAWRRGQLLVLSCIVSLVGSNELSQLDTADEFLDATLLSSVARRGKRSRLRTIGSFKISSNNRCVNLAMPWVSGGLLVSTSSSLCLGGLCLITLRDGESN